MSTYEWERGEIKIPAKEWSKFRTTLIKTHNDLQLAKLEKAKGLHAKVKDAIKGKRGSKRQEALRAFEMQHEREHGYAILRLLIRHEVDRETRQHMRIFKPLPKKKDLKIFSTSKDATLDAGDGRIVLKNADRTVTWAVSENNHACEHARAHPMGRKLFELLRRITWTRGSGGKIIGNDEYNREADYEGGGGHYVTEEFSVEAQKRQKATHVAKMSNYGGMFGGGRHW